jgi:hypothetical protein
VTRLRITRPGFDSRQGKGREGKGREGKGRDSFLSSTAYRPAVWPTQPTIQWVPRALSQEIKRPEREAYDSLSSSAEVENLWNYNSTPL